jgi:hypothetical protein
MGIISNHSLKSFFRPLMVGALMGILITTSILVVSATTTTLEGPAGYYGPVNGINYFNRNTITANHANVGVTNWVVTARTSVARNGSSTPVPTGEMGVFPRLFRSDGTLVAEASRWFYNLTPAVSLSTNVTRVNLSAGRYYSQGLTRGWNGSDYWTFASFQTPNVSVT